MMLAESGVSLESGLSFVRDAVLWLRTLVEPIGVRVAVLRATLRIDPPELAKFPSLPWPWNFELGTARDRTEARREWTESVSESVSLDPRIKDGRRARDR